jgi:hypothetical protein
VLGFFSLCSNIKYTCFKMRYLTVQIQHVNFTLSILHFIFFMHSLNVFQVIIILQAQFLMLEIHQ